MKMKTWMVPASALAASADGGAENAATPKEGDTISIKVDGTVTKVGDVISFTPTMINGQPLGDEAEGPGPDETEKPPTDEELAGWAKQSGMAT